MESDPKIGQNDPKVVRIICCVMVQSVARMTLGGVDLVWSGGKKMCREWYQSVARMTFEWSKYYLYC